MLNGYSSILHHVSTQFESDLELNRLQPFLIPRDILNFIILVAWLVATPSRSKLPRVFSYAVFALIVFLSFNTLVKRRSIGLAYGVLIGVSSAWCVILAINFVLIHDVRYFKRIVLQKQASYESVPSNRIDSGNGTPSASKNYDQGKEPKNTSAIPQGRLVWEKMPQDFWSRLGWVLDLISTFRVSNWHWASNDQQVPREFPIQAQAAYTHPSRISSLLKFIAVYMIIDTLKLAVIADPYFLMVQHSPAPTYLPHSLRGPLALSLYRRLISWMCIHGGVFLLFNIFPFLLVDVLGPTWIGLYGEPWLYPPIYGSYTAVLDSGLRGFWGIWWHQMFRQHFSSVGDGLLASLPVIKSRQTAYMIKITMAFCLSGMLHACGSYTLWGGTRPWAAFTFFALQPLGIFLQSLGLELLTRSDGPTARVGLRIANVLSTIMWLAFTFGYLADDFASGGMWLFEPLPVSPLRGLGFGTDSGHWWCWNERVVRWYQGQDAWSSGILF